MNNPVLMTPSFREMETEIPQVGNRQYFTFELRLYALLEPCKGCFTPQLRQGLDKFHYEHLTTSIKCNVPCVHEIETYGFSLTGTLVS